MKFFWLILFFAACSPVKQVLRSPEKTLAVVGEYLKRYPLSSETKYQILPGDSIVSVDVRTDTLYIYDSAHTLPQKVVTQNIIKTIVKTDTVLKTTIDRQGLIALQQQLVAKDIQLVQMQEDHDALLQSRNQFRLWFWLIVAALGGSALFLLYKNLKP